MSTTAETGPTGVEPPSGIGYRACRCRRPPAEAVWERVAAVDRGLLQQTDVRLSEVYLSIGFEDQSHFTSMFRRVGDLTPGQMHRAALGRQA